MLSTSSTYHQHHHHLMLKLCYHFTFTGAVTSSSFYQHNFMLKLCYHSTFTHQRSYQLEVSTSHSSSHSIISPLIIHSTNLLQHQDSTMLDENPNDVENVPQSPFFANESTSLLILLLTVRTFNPTILQIPRLISQESANCLLLSSLLSARIIGPQQPAPDSDSNNRKETTLTVMIKSQMIQMTTTRIILKVHQILTHMIPKMSKTVGTRQR